MKWINLDKKNQRNIIGCGTYCWISTKDVKGYYCLIVHSCHDVPLARRMKTASVWTQQTNCIVKTKYSVLFRWKNHSVSKQPKRIRYVKYLEAIWSDPAQRLLHLSYCYAFNAPNWKLSRAHWFALVFKIYILCHTWYTVDACYHTILCEHTFVRMKWFYFAENIFIPLKYILFPMSSHWVCDLMPPSVMFYMFNTLIQPILLYGSEIWGVRKTGCSAIDKVFFSFMKHILYVKQSTSNIITIGECGQIPPSVVCHTNVIKYMDRVRNMNDCHFVKQVYNELSRLHELGFTTWYSRALKLGQQYNIDLFNNDGDFKTYCKLFIENKFRENRELDVQNVDKNPIHLQSSGRWNTLCYGLCHECIRKKYTSLQHHSRLQLLWKPG